MTKTSPRHVAMPALPALLALACLSLGCGDSSPGSGGEPDGSVVPGDGALAGVDSGGAKCNRGPEGIFDLTVDVDGVARTYKLVVPSGAADTARPGPMPLVFAWHGRTSNSAQARSYFGVEEASAGAAIFVYPQGLPVTASPTDTGWDLTANSPDLLFFDAMLQQVTTDYCVDESRVFSIGHSMGGFMSTHLGCMRGRVIRGIASVAGGGPFASCVGDPVAAFVVHGTLDAVVNVSMGENARDFWRTTNSCEDTTAPVDPSPCVAYQGCGVNPLQWCLHSEPQFNGHGWPSFAPAAIWNFLDLLPPRS